MGRHFGAGGKRTRRPTQVHAATRGGASTECDVTILRWAHGGEGVAIPETGDWAGRVTFVGGVVPGDRVRVEPVEIRDRWVRARVVRMLEPSPERRPVACAVQARCGGCPWMEGSADAQRASREAILTGELRKRLGRADVPVEMRPTPARDGYRQRLRLQIRDGKLGFHGRASHDFVPIVDCPIAVESIRTELPALARSVAAVPNGRATILAGIDGVATFVEPAAATAFHIGPTAVTVDFGSVRQRLAPEAFAQANPAVVAQVLADVRALADAVRRPDDPERLLAAELFAGSGTLTTALWAAGFDVDAWEVADAARPAFEATRSALGLTPDAGRWAACDLLSTGFVNPPPRRRPDVVLLDPPRIGALPIVPWLRRSGARRIIYLACDLAAGLRDVAALTVASPEAPPPAWRLARAIAYDMFPHSGHQEVLFVLDPV